MATLSRAIGHAKYGIAELNSKIVPTVGIEPTANGLKVQRSTELSYEGGEVMESCPSLDLARRSPVHAPSSLSK